MAQVGFRRYLFSAIFGAAILPVLLLSIILLNQLNQHYAQQISSAIEAKLELLSNRFINDVELFRANLEQISTDQNVILVPKNAVFSVKVNERITSYRESTQAVDLIQVYDKVQWPVETTPSVFQFFTDPVLSESIVEFTNERNIYKKFVYLELEKLAEALGHPEEVSWKQFLMYGIRLDQFNETNPDDAIINGVLVGVISIKKLIEQFPFKPHERLSVIRNGVEVVIREEITLDEEDWEFGQSDVNLAGEAFTLKYGIRKSVAYSAQNNAFGTVILFLIAIIGIAIAIVLFLSDRISKPIKSLVEVVSHYGYGDDQFPVPEFTINELTELRNGLVKMNDVIQQGKEDLEGKVDSRTKELASANGQLQDNLDTMQTMQNQLVEQEKMALLGQLVAGVAHEINTPLGIALTACSSLASETSGIETVYKEGKLSQSDFKRYLEHCLESTDLAQRNLRRAADLIQNFKLVSADRSHGEEREFELKEYLHGLVDTLWPEIKKYKPEVNLEMDEHLEVKTYPGVLAHVFTNLILNSTIHGFKDHENNRINISAEVNEEYLVLAYSDNGQGISDEVKSKIFEPFFTTKRGKGGTGLGMHIVYNQITQKLHGHVKIEDNDPTGVRFILELPNDIVK